MVSLASPSLSDRPSDGLVEDLVKEHLFDFSAVQQALEAQGWELSAEDCRLQYSRIRSEAEGGGDMEPALNKPANDTELTVEEVFAESERIRAAQRKKVDAVFDRVSESLGVLMSNSQGSLAAVNTPARASAAAALPAVNRSPQQPTAEDQAKKRAEQEAEWEAHFHATIAAHDSAREGPAGQVAGGGGGDGGGGGEAGGVQLEMPDFLNDLLAAEELGGGGVGAGEVGSGDGDSAEDGKEDEEKKE